MTNQMCRRNRAAGILMAVGFLDDDDDLQVMVLCQKAFMYAENGNSKDTVKTLEQLLNFTKNQFPNWDNDFQQTLNTVLYRAEKADTIDIIKPVIDEFLIREKMKQVLLPVLDS
jgi:hypothetical protein